MAAPSETRDVRARAGHRAARSHRGLRQVLAAGRSPRCRMRRVRRQCGAALSSTATLSLCPRLGASKTCEATCSALAPRLREHLGRLLVPQRALRSAQVAVDRLAYERVDEGQRLFVLHDLGAGQHGQGRRRARLAQPRQCGHGLKPRAVARARPPPAPPRLTSAGNRRSRMSTTLDTARDPTATDQVCVRRVGTHATGSRERAAADGAAADCPRWSGDTQRRTAGRPVHRGAGQPSLRSRGCQRQGSDDDGGWLVQQLGQELLAVVLLAGQHRAEHQDRCRIEPAGEVGEVAQRRAVAPLDVVDGQHHGTGQSG